MGYKIQRLSTEDLREVLATLPPSISRTSLFLALRDGPQPVGRAFDQDTVNFLIKLPKEVRSPGFGFYCFWCRESLCEFLLLESYLPDIVLERPLPSGMNEVEFTAELSVAITIHGLFLTTSNGEIISKGGAFVPIIRDRINLMPT